MAYTLHITKKKNWKDEEPRISQEEWNNLFVNGILEVINAEDHRGWDAKKGDVYFAFDEGNIECNPRNEKQIETMKEVAVILGARVQGDDGELY